jgi:hypothetical protein
MGERRPKGRVKTELLYEYNSIISHILISLSLSLSLFKKKIFFAFWRRDNLDEKWSPHESVDDFCWGNWDGGKIKQTYDCMIYRHGNMLVGRTGSGKTVAWKALQNAWRQLKEEGLEGWQRVWVYIMNSLALSNDEIYGCTSKVFFNTHLSLSKPYTPNPKPYFFRHCTFELWNQWLHQQDPFQHISLPL